MKEWDQVDLSDVADVRVWGGNPVDAQSRNDYYDSLYHSAVVAGLNTSAFIEAGIVGRPVHTILLPEWHENQLGTLHFRYLFEAGGGLLNSARSYDEHFAQLDAALANPSTEIKPFVRTFVRPYGLDVAATPLFTAAVESLASVRAAGNRPEWGEGVSRRVLERMLALRHSEPHERWLYSERERESIQRLRDGRTRKAQQRAADRRAREAAKQARADARLRAIEEHRAAKEAKDAMKKQERLAARAAAREARRAEKAASEKVTG
jgi:hypothetical protein